MNNIQIFTDGGSRGNPGPAAIGISVEVDRVVVFEKSAFIGTATNNIAEYEAVVQALEWLNSPDCKFTHNHAAFLSDSKLLVEQLSGRYAVKQPHLKVYVEKAKRFIQNLRVKDIQVSFTHIPREKNSAADALVNQALDAAR